MSLRICADSPEHSLLAYANYVLMQIPKHIPRAKFDTTVKVSVISMCAYTISTKISCAGLHNILLRALYFQVFSKLWLRPHQEISVTLNQSI